MALPNGIRRSERIQKISLQKEYNQNLPIISKPRILQPVMEKICPRQMLKRPSMKNKKQEKICPRQKLKRPSKENKKHLQKDVSSRVVGPSITMPLPNGTCYDKVPESVQGIVQEGAEVYIIIKWKGKESLEYIPKKNLTSSLKKLAISFLSSQLNQYMNTPHDVGSDAVDCERSKDANVPQERDEQASQEEHGNSNTMENNLNPSVPTYPSLSMQKISILKYRYQQKLAMKEYELFTGQKIKTVHVMVD